MSYRIFVNATMDRNQRISEDCSLAVIVPIRVEIDGQHYIYGPNGTISIGEFYDAQREEKKLKIQPLTVEEYFDFFDEWLAKGEDILYMVSSVIPNSFSILTVCLRELRKKYKDRQIFFVDTYAVSIGETLLLYEVLRQQKEGTSIEELAGWLIEGRLNVCQWFAINTFEHLLQADMEIPFMRGIENIYRINPLLGMDENGELVLTEKLSGTPKTMYSMFSRLERGWRPEYGNKIIIGYSECSEYAEELRKCLLYECCIADIIVTELGPGIGIYTGSEALAIAYWGSNRLSDKKKY